VGVSPAPRRTPASGARRGRGVGGPPAHRGASASGAPRRGGAVMSLMTLRIALRALGRNKVRSALTMLGVIIGVAAVIAMVAIGQGATHMVQKQIESMGQNLLMIFPGSTSSGAVSYGVGTQQTLTPGDAVAIARDCTS